MTRGLGGRSPANVAYYLKGIDFPAEKQQLLQCAEDNGAEDAVLDVIEEFDDGDEFESMADVMVAYGDAEANLREREGGEQDRGGAYREGGGYRSGGSYRQQGRMRGGGSRGYEQPRPRRDY